MSIRLNPHQAFPWNQQDSINLRTFLASETGKRLVLRLRSERPGFSPTRSSTLEQRALEGSAIEGYELAIWNLFDYIVTPQAENATAGAYPSLDLDALWPTELQIPEPLPDDNPTSVL